MDAASLALFAVSVSMILAVGWTIFVPTKTRLTRFLAIGLFLLASLACWWAWAHSDSRGWTLVYAMIAAMGLLAVVRQFVANFFDGT